MPGTNPNACWRRIAVLGVCLGLTTATGGAVPSHSSGGQRAASERPAPAQLRGTVTLAGDAVPEASEVINTTDPDACGRLQSRRDLVISGTGRGIRNVIVAVTGIPEDAAPTVEPGRVVLANRDCQFEPHAAVLTVGSTLETVNEDGVLHTVHLYGAREENLSLPVEGMSREVVLETPGMITILCDVHGWMRAHVRVDPHPFHAVTDEEGRFVIPDVPAGTWQLEIWHERLGRQTRTVRLDPGSTGEIEVAYSLD